MQLSDKQSPVPEEEGEGERRGERGGEREEEDEEEEKEESDIAPTTSHVVFLGNVRQLWLPQFRSC